MLFHRQGVTTLRLVRPRGSRPMTPRVVMGVLSDIWPTAVDKVGKIKIVDDQKADGAVFDLPEDVAKELLSKPTRSGEVIDVCQSVSSTSPSQTFLLAETGIAWKFLQNILASAT